MSQHRIACLLHDKFEDSEFFEPAMTLSKKGFQVDIVSIQKGKLLSGKAKSGEVETTIGIDDCSAADYLGILIPGGESVVLLCGDKRFVDFVCEFSKSEKPIAAISHGMQLLIAADLVKDRKMASSETVRKQLQEAGSNVVNEAVVSDGTTITSRNVNDIAAFVEAVVLQFETNSGQSWMARGDLQPADSGISSAD